MQLYCVFSQTFIQPVLFLQTGALSGNIAIKSKQTQKYKKQKSWKNNMKNCQEMQIKQNKMHNRNRCKAIKKIQIPLLTNKNYA